MAVFVRQGTGVDLTKAAILKVTSEDIDELAANKVTYNDTQTQLGADNVQSAIQKLKTNFQGGVDSIYNACVAKGSTPASHSLSDVVAGINAIPTGSTPTGTISITTNGTKDVTNYASANVQVPASAVVSGTKNITTNGNHDVTNYATAYVSGIPTLDTYEFPVGSTGARTVVSQYNYASATNVYNKGVADGSAGKTTINIQDIGSNTWNGSDGVSNPYSFTATVGAYYSVAIGGIRGDESTTFTGSGFSLLGYSRVSNSTYSPEDHLSGVLHGIIQATATTVSISANFVWPYTNGAISVMQIGT